MLVCKSGHRKMSSGVAPQIFWKSVPAIIMIAGSFFKPKGKELFYVLFFIELALSAEEDFQQPVDRCQQYNTGADSETIPDDTNRSEIISQDI